MRVRSESVVIESGASGGRFASITTHRVRLIFADDERGIG
jgi:hypothetical protein